MSDAESQTQQKPQANIKRWVILALVVLIVAALGYVAATSRGIKTRVKDMVLGGSGYAVEDQFTDDGVRYVLVSSWDSDPSGGYLSVDRCNALGFACEQIWRSDYVRLGQRTTFVEVNGKLGVRRGTSILKEIE